MPFPSWPELHGALTHFPVALLITAVVYDIVSAVFRRPSLRTVSFWLLVGAVVMAIPSLATGWLTGSQLFGGAARPPTVFFWHRAAAFTTFGIALILLAWRVKSRDGLDGGALTASIVLALIAAGGVGYTGYLGGTMVFGSASQGSAAESRPPSSPAVTTSAADPQDVQAGERLFKSSKCQSCHKMEGQGGATGPDLTHEARRHADLQWHIAHLKNPAKMSPGSVMPSFATLKPDTLQALAAYLASRR